MIVNYIFGNGFSIMIDKSFDYSFLLKGFVDHFYKITIGKSNKGIIIPEIFEKNPEVAFSRYLSSIKVQEFGKFTALLFQIQNELKKYLVKKMRNKKKIGKKGELENYSKESKTITTNYDLNIENIFNIDVIHLHGRIDNYDSIILSNAAYKDVVIKNIDYYLRSLKGEVRIFGLRPNFDKHIWERIISNNKITKIEFSYYFKDKKEKEISKEFTNKNKKLFSISSEEFEKKYFNIIHSNE